MASNKKEFGTPWSKTYKLYNKFAIGVHNFGIYTVASGESLKVFFVTKFRVFYIYVSQNSM